MEINQALYQQHLTKGWISYLDIFIDSLTVKNMPNQQQLIIDKCYQDIKKNQMDTVSFELIIHQLVTDLNQPMVVWRMLKNLRINQLFIRGPLYLYLISLPDIKSCIPEIVRLIGVFLEPSYSLKTYQENQKVFIEPQELVHKGLASFIKADTALGITLFLLKELAAPDFDYETIHIPNNRTPFNCDWISPVTNADFVFHQGPMMASFPVEFLNIKNKSFNPEYSLNLKLQVNELLATLEISLSLTERVRKYILSVEKPAMQTTQSTAEVFGMSQTTFRRKLKVENQSFKHIQSEILDAISIKALSTTTMKIDDFAQYIGYSDRSSFERSFIKSFGLSPAKYRKKYQVK